jgi:hypothetical protein
MSYLRPMNLVASARGCRILLVASLIAVGACEPRDPYQAYCEAAFGLVGAIDSARSAVAAIEDGDGPAAAQFGAEARSRLAEANDRLEPQDSYGPNNPVRKALEEAAVELEHGLGSDRYRR